jgi:hypothetical protein
VRERWGWEMDVREMDVREMDASFGGEAREKEAEDIV